MMQLKSFRLTLPLKPEVPEDIDDPPRGLSFAAFKKLRPL